MLPNLESIESLLLRISNADTRENVENLRDEFLEEVRKAVNCKDLFSPELSNKKRDEIALCLVRLISANDEAFENWKDRNRAYNLFDEQLTYLYDHYELNPDLQGYKKIQNLKEAETDILDKFRQITNTISSLGVAQNIRTRFMQAINNNLSRYFLEPFLDPQLSSNERLGELFEALKEYDTATEIDKVKAFRHAESVFARYLSDINESSDKISDVILGKPFKKIYQLIKNDFSTSDTNQPAELSLTGAERKYPFNQKGRKVEIKVIVDNERGYAFNAMLECPDISEGLRVPQASLSLPNIGPGQHPFFIPAVVESESEKDHVVHLQLSWEDYEGNKRSIEEILDLESQHSNLDWDTLATKSPYSLEPLNREEELVGRSQLIETLFTNLAKDNVESYILFGQKRVGKTSIAKTVQNKLRNEIDDCYPIYVPVGALDKTDAARFVAELGEEIVFDLNGTDLGELGVDEPEFKSALAPLRKFLRRLHRLKSETKIIIIIDEFDELPLDLIKYTKIQDTFFHNLRELINLEYVGFVFVGGENMRIIREYSATDRLNKVVNKRVDYLNEWKDFRDLVTKPVEGILEYEDGAIRKLYDLTEGNPFFTNFICKNIYKDRCDRRISYVASEDIDLAVNRTIGRIEFGHGSLSLNNMSHFWIDGNSARDMAKKDEIETQRKKFLLGYAREKRRKASSLTEEELQESDHFSTEVSINQMIESYKKREILLVNERGQCRLKPRFFEKWLVETGLSQISTRFLDEDAIEEMRLREEKLYVRDEEIVQLIDSWGTYMGVKKETGHVRKWLNQFNGVKEQRLMFKLLKNLRFYNQVQVREAVRTIHSRVKTHRVQKEGERKRRDILLSAFGDVDKSDSSFARIYRQENDIFHKNITGRDKLASFFEKEDSDRIRALVFVDDIFGSGTQKSGALKRLNEELGTVLANRDIRVYITAICGFRDGLERIEGVTQKTEFDTEVYTVHELTEADKCFGEDTAFFESDSDRREAKQIARRYGGKLDKKQPLGYRGSELLVVFHENCPNNSLPIIWKETKDWTPLFARK